MPATYSPPEMMGASRKPFSAVLSPTAALKENTSARPQLRFRDRRLPYARDQRDLPRALPESFQRRRERSAVVAIDAGLLFDVRKSEAAKRQCSVRGRPRRTLTEARDLLLRLHPFAAHGSFKGFPLFCPAHEHGHIVGIVYLGHGITEWRMNGKGNALGYKFFAHRSDRFRIGHAPDFYPRNYHAGFYASRSADEKKGAPCNKERQTAGKQSLHSLSRRRANASKRRSSGQNGG